MRFDELQLIRCGPFTNQVLELDQGQFGLHFIYGPNEAGKSSTLRALKYLLYGFPAQLEDDFLHSYKNLRVGAILRPAQGEPLHVIRRKGNVKTLRASDDQTVVEESELRALLGPIDESTFAMQFGIDHPTLVQGGKSIVEGEGEIGEILFSAGAGIADLHEMQGQLYDEAAELFLPNGKRQINDALAQLEAAREQVKAALVPSSLAAEHEETKQRRESVAEELQEANRQRARLERLREALPLISQRAELLRQQSQVAEAPLLPEDRSAERRELQTRLAATQSLAQETQGRLRKIQEELAGIEVSQELIDQAETIEPLRERIGSYRKAIEDRERLSTQLKLHEAAAERRMRDLQHHGPLESVEQLRLSKQQRIRIQTLGGQFDGLLRQYREAQDQAETSQQQCQQLRQQLANLPTLPPLDTLQAGLRRARQQGNLQEHWEAASAELTRQRRGLLLELRKLSHFPGELSVQSFEGQEIPFSVFTQFESLPIPGEETIERFDGEFRDAQEAVRDAQRQLDRVQQELFQVEAALEQQRLQHDLPSEEDLEQAREQRNLGWQLLRRHWEHGDPDPHQVEEFLVSLDWGHDLAEAVEQSFFEVDELSDRLRREADKIAERARLTSQQSSLERQQTELQTQLEQARQHQAEVQRRWDELWAKAALEARTPREMAAWLRKHARLTEQMEAVRQQQALVDGLAARMEQLAEELRESLAPFETSLPKHETLERLVEHAEVVCEKLEAQQMQREQLERDLSACEAALPQMERQVSLAQESLERWRADWAGAVAQLGLDDQAEPEVATAMLESLNELFADLEKTYELRERIEGADQEARQFHEFVKALVTRIAPDLQETPPAEAALELSQRLLRTHSAVQRRASLWQQSEQEESSLRQTQQQLAAWQGQLQVMCQEAQVAAAEELPQAEQRSTTKRQLLDELDRCEGQLRQLAGGSPLEDFIAAAAEIDPDMIEPKLAYLAERSEHLEQQREELDQQIGAQKSQMDGRATAAEAQERVQEIVAEIEELSQRYIRLKLASVLLKQAIERYREKHQDPVLRRASELFAHLTCYSFERLQIDVDERSGEHRLFGLKAGNKLIPVQGMSDGTADQLYLALRIASLETYLHAHEPIPLIVDDVLIQCDDQRAIAALQTFAELSGQTQVIFFTHHQHLVELAEKVLPKHVFFKHALNPRSATAAVGRLF